MIRERTAVGKRGQTTKICTAWSSVAFLHESPPLGSTDAFHDHSSSGVSLRFTLPLMSREIVEPSLALRRCRTLRLPCASIEKSYFGLPQLCFCQLDGTPDRKSTRLNSSHLVISYAVFCLKKKKQKYLKFFYITKKKKNKK